MDYRYGPKAKRWWFHHEEILLTGGGGIFTQAEFTAKLEDACARGWYPWQEHPMRPVDIEYILDAELGNITAGVVLEKTAVRDSRYRYELLWCGISLTPG